MLLTRHVTSRDNICCVAVVQCSSSSSVTPDRVCFSRGMSWVLTPAVISVIAWRRRPTWCCRSAYHWSLVWSRGLDLTSGRYAIRCSYSKVLEKYLGDRDTKSIQDPNPVNINNKKYQPVHTSPIVEDLQNWIHQSAVQAATAWWAAKFMVQNGPNDPLTGPWTVFSTSQLRLRQLYTVQDYTPMGRG